MGWLVAPHETIAPMSTSTRLLRRVPAPLAVMALIFFFSAQPDLGTDLGVIDLIGRKIAHATIYAALTLLWWWALDPTAEVRFRQGGGEPDAAGGRRRRLTLSMSAAVSRGPLVLSASIAFLYAISDEFHQTFVDGRVGSPIDVGIDTLGIAFACWLVVSRRGRQGGRQEPSSASRNRRV